VKDERDDEAVDRTLAALSDAIANDENVMPYVIDAVKAYATMARSWASSRSTTVVIRKNFRPSDPDRRLSPVRQNHTASSERPIYG